jgi:hypothetical protein
MECEVNDSCWCHRMPHISLDLENKGCYCSACLELEMSTIINSYDGIIADDIKKQIHQSYNYVDMTLTEGVDFLYNEDGMMTLTRWYLLKRGYCCDNGCKNCPYRD